MIRPHLMVFWNNEDEHTGDNEGEEKKENERNGRNEKGWDDKC